MGFTGKPDRENLKKCFLCRLGRIDDAEDGGKRIYIIKPENEEGCLGYMQFTRCGEEIEIAISVGEDSQGKGVGKEAVGCAAAILSRLGVKAVARIRDDNVRSQKCFVANGFVRTDDFEPVDYPASGTVNFRRYESAGQNTQSK